jgi:hypothetical protein
LSAASFNASPGPPLGDGGDVDGDEAGDVPGDEAGDEHAATTRATSTAVMTAFDRSRMPLMFVRRGAPRLCSAIRVRQLSDEPWELGKGRKRLPAMARFIASILIFLAACSGSGASPTPPTQPTPSSSPPPAVMPLVTLRLEGGMCPRGACASSFEIRSDGLIVRRTPTAALLGQLSAAQLATLQVSIGTTDFDTILTHPFTGTCPIAFDGQERTYGFATSRGDVQLASCVIDLDPAPAVVALVDDLIDKAAR